MPVRRLIATWIALLALILTSAAVAGAQKQTLVLAVTSDLQGEMEPFWVREDGKKIRLGGMARLAGALKKLRQDYPDAVLTLASGDDLMGRYFRAFGGRAVYGALNALGMSVATVGNHEFDYGPKYLAQALASARFPLVVSNLSTPSGSPLSGLFRDKLMLKALGLRIGVLGLITPELDQLTRVEGSVTLRGDIYQSARQAVNALRAQGADLILALTHLGLEQDKLLAARVGGIDVICGGHSHTLLPSGKEEVVERPEGGRTIIVQAGKGGTHLGRLTLVLDGPRIISHKWVALPMDNTVTADREVAKLVTSFKEQLPPPRVLAQTTVELDCRGEIVRRDESPVANLITDIMRNQFKTDLAFINAGNIRGDRIIPPGPVTTADLETILPFGNEVTVLSLKGAALIKVLEWGLAGLHLGKGRFLQVSGMRYFARGGKVVKAEVQDGQGIFQPLIPDKIYRAATNSYLAGGGDGFTMLTQEAKVREDTYVSLLSLVEMNIKRLSPLTPKVEGRIKLEE